MAIHRYRRELEKQSDFQRFPIASSILIFALVIFIYVAIVAIGKSFGNDSSNLIYLKHLSSPCDSTCIMPDQVLPLPIALGRYVSSEAIKSLRQGKSIDLDKLIKTNSITFRDNEYSLYDLYVRAMVNEYVKAHK